MHDFEGILDLLKKINLLSFEEVDIETNGVKIHTKKHEYCQEMKSLDNTKDIKENEEINDDTYFFRSPIVGTIYLTPNPDEEPYIKEGDEIKIGETICLIEAMKIFNEIKSDISGKIVKILVENSSPIEYGQKIFVIKKY